MPRTSPVVGSESRPIHLAQRSGAPRFVVRNALAIHDRSRKRPTDVNISAVTRRKVAAGRGKYRRRGPSTVNREMVHISVGTTIHASAGVKERHIDIGGIGRGQGREGKAYNQRQKKAATRQDGPPKTNAGFDYSRSRQAFLLGGTLLKSATAMPIGAQGLARCRKHLQIAEIVK